LNRIRSLSIQRPVFITTRSDLTRPNRNRRSPDRPFPRARARRRRARHHGGAARRRTTTQNPGYQRVSQTYMWDADAKVNRDRASHRRWRCGGCCPRRRAGSRRRQTHGEELRHCLPPITPGKSMCTISVSPRSAPAQIRDRDRDRPWRRRHWVSWCWFRTR
jgi:hypothetical protein